MSENVHSDICALRRFRSACAFAQSDLNLHWAHLNTCVAKDAKLLFVFFCFFVFFSCGQRRLIRLSDAQAELSLILVHMLEGTLSHVGAQQCGAYCCDG